MTSSMTYKHTLASSRWIMLLLAALACPAMAFARADLFFFVLDFVLDRKYGLCENGITNRGARGTNKSA